MSAVTVPHALRIIPVAQITRCYKRRNQATINYTGFPIDIKPILGSLNTTTRSEGEIDYVNLTFLVPATDSKTAELLKNMCATRFLALYRNERGSDTMLGTPQWPATMTSVREGSVYKVTITASVPYGDLFLVR